MTIQFSEDSLNTWVDQIAQLVNLVTTQGADEGDVVLRSDWFQNPWGTDDNPNIAYAPRRPTQLFTLIASFLDPAADDPLVPQLSSPMGDALSWYPIDLKGSPTGVYAVLSDPSAPYDDTHPAYAGVGVWNKYVFSGSNDPAPTEEEDTGLQNAVSFGIYAPLYELLTDAGPAFCMGKADTPINIQITATTATGFATRTIDGEDVLLDTCVVSVNLFVDSDTDSSVSVSFLNSETGQSIVANTWAELIEQSFAGLINAVLAMDSVDTWLRTNIGSSTITPGQILVAIDVLSDTEPYTLANIQANFGDLTALQIAENMVFGVIDMFADLGKPLIPIKTGGIYVVSQDADPGKTYGARLQLPDIELGKVAPPPDSGGTPAPSEPSSGSNQNKPQLTLQLGQWLKGEGDYDASWLSRATTTEPPVTDPGVTLLLITNAATSGAPDVSFTPSLQFVSIGFDFEGANGNPLVDVLGFSLGGFEARAWASLNLTSPLDFRCGGAVRTDDIGIAFGTSFDAPTAEGDNETASNLVASGDGEGGNAATDQTDPVNPPFSISGAYADQLNVQLYDENDVPTDVVWVTIQQSYGPLTLQKIGVGWEQTGYLLSFIVDGGVAAGGFSLDLINLSLNIDVQQLTDLSSYSLGLDGFDVGFKAGPVDINAGFLHSTTAGGESEYDGQGLLQMGRIGISVMGSYATVDDSPSLFLFALLNMPLGGIPAIFVNGLSAGFGYNRDLTLPPIDGVGSYPLVAGIDDPTQLGGENPTPTEALASLSDWVTPSRGDYWLAGGIKWTTYDIVNTNAMLSVEFGNDVELGVLGLAKVSLPQGTEKKFAYAELGIELVLDFGADDLIVSAVLSDNSYLFAPSFKITGGFALCAWWGDQEAAGDFVVSLGGYNPGYTPPAYYPSLSRLGFSFAFSEALTLKGDVYFALTTSNIMAGGEFQFQFKAGPYAMWFTADADLILYWNPFYFDAHLAISAGASYNITLFGASTTIQIEATGTLDLWSPETGGKIEIDFWFMKLPISFGADQDTSAATPIDWAGFEDMIPDASDAPAPAEKVARPKPSAKMSAVATEESDPPAKAVLQINVTHGLLSTLPALTEGGPLQWVIRSSAFTFFTKSYFPSTSLEFTDGAIGTTVEIDSSSAELGIAPMAYDVSEAVQTITIEGPNDSTPMAAADWVVLGSKMGMPKAVFGQTDGSAPVATPECVEDCITGTSAVHHARHAALTGTGPFSLISALAYTPVGSTADDLPLDVAIAPSEPAPEPDPNSISDISDITGLQNSRDAIHAALAEMGVDAGQNGALSAMATNPGGVFSGAPMAGAVAS